MPRIAPHHAPNREGQSATMKWVRINETWYQRKSDCPNQVSSIGQCFATNQTPLRFQPISKKRENLFPSIGGRFLAVTLLVDEILKPVPGAVVAVKLVLDAGGGERGG